MKPGHGRHPARATDADPRLRRPLPGADDQGHARARRSRSARSTTAGATSTCTCTAASRQPQFDGHPHDPIPNGAERLYKYPNVQRSATLWYHDHAHGETAKTLFAGLAAFYILNDPDDKRPRAAPGRLRRAADDQDRAFNADGSFRYKVDLDRGFRGDTILVNGAVAPRMKVERRLYRLRFLNASNARAYELALGNGRPMVQIASDGGLLPAPVDARRRSRWSRPSAST